MCLQRPHCCARHGGESSSGSARQSRSKAGSWVRLVSCRMVSCDVGGDPTRCSTTVESGDLAAVLLAGSVRGFRVSLESCHSSPQGRLIAVAPSVLGWALLVGLHGKHAATTSSCGHQRWGARMWCTIPSSAPYFGVFNCDDFQHHSQQGTWSHPEVRGESTRSEPNMDVLTHGTVRRRVG